MFYIQSDFESNFNIKRCKAYKRRKYFFDSTSSSESVNEMSSSKRVKSHNSKSKPLPKNYFINYEAEVSSNYNSNSDENISISSISNDSFINDESDVDNEYDISLHHKCDNQLNH